MNWAYRGGVDQATEVWRLLTEVLRERKEEFPSLAASIGLNPGALHALMSLDENEPKSMSALAGDWKCDASNVTWLVDRLEDAGFAERLPHPTDRRGRPPPPAPQGPHGPGPTAAQN